MYVSVCGTNRQIIAEFREILLKRFEGTEAGDLPHYLGCIITRDLLNGTTELSQAHYAEHVIKKFNMWDC